MSTRPLRRALISVYDKTGIVEFARALHEKFKVEIISTGGTARTLREAGIPVTLVEDLTGCPELLDGRVKTLHPRIFAAILADRDNPEHMRQLAEQGIEPIDLVVVNLYPFEQTVADPNCTFEQALEMIDIGGVALLRAAAKNHLHVFVPTCTEDYRFLMTMWPDALTDEGWRGVRRDYAVWSLELTNRYDAAIARWLSQGDAHACHLRRVEPLRYGENPHQTADLFEESRGGETAVGTPVGGGRGVLPSFGCLLRNEQPSSYNNYLDADAALALCAELTRELRDEPRTTVRADAENPRTSVRGSSEVAALAPPTARRARVVVFVKHTNPCGVGVACPTEDSPAAVAAARVEAYRRAYLGDPNAAMGGILACNFEVDAAFAAVVMETYDRLAKPLKAAGHACAPGGFFLEVWLAPRFTDAAVSIIRGTAEPTPERPNPPRKKWGESVRLLAVGDMSFPPEANKLVYRSIAGGMLVQTPDLVGLNEEQWRVVTRRAPTGAEWADLRLAWLVCKHTKSNAITICKDGLLLGNGAGQMSRVMSCRVATWLARENGHAEQLKGAVAASDAFFPFRDGPDLLLSAGVTALIQPGGGKRDEETIAACDERGAALVFTGTRHFKH